MLGIDSETTDGKAKVGGVEEKEGIWVERVEEGIAEMGQGEKHIVALCDWGLVADTMQLAGYWSLFWVNILL